MGTSRTWGAENFNKPAGGTLEKVVADLNPAAKQAMYAAANKGLIRRGTWDGCAFNAGGYEVGDNNVTSYFAAAKAFGLDEKKVVNFIRVWDGLNGDDETCTNRLKAAILAAGLYTEPGESSSRRILRQTIYKSQETQMREKFEAQIADLDMSDLENEQVMQIKGVSELLSASCS